MRNFSSFTIPALCKPAIINHPPSEERRKKMSNFTSIVEYFGFTCPVGGDFYICEDAINWFIGCCTSDPCADDTGICPDGNLHAASFDRSKNEVIPSQNCDDSRGANVWYTCAYTNPPFFGCCDVYPCTIESGCSRSNVLPSVLSFVKETRLLLLAPGKPEISSSVASDANTSTPTFSSTPTSSARQSSPGAGWRALSPGEVVGVTVGVVLLALIFLGLLLKAWWTPQRRIR